MTTLICPACGGEIDVLKISAHPKVCPGFKVALMDAKKGGRKPMQQRDIVKIKPSFSERWADFVLDSDWMRRHWFPSFVAVTFLSWLVGFETPNPGFVLTVLIMPSIVGAVIVVMFGWSRIRKAREWKK